MDPPGDYTLGRSPQVPDSPRSEERKGDRRENHVLLNIALSVVPTYSLALFAAVVSLWIDPPDYFILLGVEARKLLIRIDPTEENGIVGRVTYF